MIERTVRDVKRVQKGCGNDWKILADLQMRNHDVRALVRPAPDTACSKIRRLINTLAGPGHFLVNQSSVKSAVTRIIE